MPEYSFENIPGSPYFEGTFEDGLTTVESIQNPITRSMVRLDPFFEFTDEANFGKFYEAFVEYCQLVWRMSYNDPGTLSSGIDPVTGQPLWWLGMVNLKLTAAGVDPEGPVTDE